MRFGNKEEFLSWLYGKVALSNVRGAGHISNLIFRVPWSSESSLIHIKWSLTLFARNPIYMKDLTQRVKKTVEFISMYKTKFIFAYKTNGVDIDDAEIERFNSLW